MPTPEAIAGHGEHRALVISDVLFGLRERLEACDELADEAPGNRLAAADLLDTIDEIHRRGVVLRSLGLGT